MILDDEVFTALEIAASDFLTANGTISTDTGDVTGLPTMAAGNIQWTNKKFDPKAKGDTARVSIIGNTPNPRNIGKRGKDVFTGFMQIDIDTVNDTGGAVHRAWNKKARLFFHAGRKFTSNGQSLLVTSSGMNNGEFVGPVFRRAITVFFEAYLTRAILT